MGLSYCTSCQAVEGGFKEATPEELKAQGFDPEEIIEVCCQCGEAGTYESIPEHDDYDLER